jgi:hypothetical protein
MTREEILMSNAKLAANYLAAQAAGTPPPVLEPVPDNDSEIAWLLVRAKDSNTSAEERYELASQVRELRAGGKKPPPPLPLDDQIKDLLTKAKDPATSPKERYELASQVRELRAQPGRWDAVQFTPAGR